VSRPPLIGVLALQGDVREHLRALTACGADVRPVRRPEDLDGLGGILQAGLPAYGSCAGMILLAKTVLDGTEDQQTFGALDITVRRNAFGRQVESFETDVDLDGIEGGPMHAVFIRAPWVESIDNGVQVLGAVVPPGLNESKIIAVRYQNVLATSFHPEVTDDLRIHCYFVDLVRAAR
jgi:5'-phosphate synthase pdxT subunit